MSFEINGRPIGLGHPPYVIAELSGNHNGSLEKAFAAIDAAVVSGVDAVKLQTYTAETLTIDCDSPDFIIRGGLWDGLKLYDLYRWAETPFEWQRPLFEYGRSRGITVFSTPFDEAAVDLLEDLGSPAYKIASFEMVDLALIRYVASTGKPLIMSTGLASKEEISEAVEVARTAGCRDLALLHCISSYPTPIDQANLGQITNVSRDFNVIGGLSDHTMGTTAAVAAVALGASLIEKHFTITRDEKGPDSEFSAEPEELSRLCKEVRDVWLALRDRGYKRAESEVASTIFRRSLYFVRDLPKGAVVGFGDIRCIRPGKGLAPKHFDLIIGRRLTSSVVRGTATSWELFED